MRARPDFRGFGGHLGQLTCSLVEVGLRVRPGKKDEKGPDGLASGWVPARDLSCMSRRVHGHTGTRPRTAPQTRPRRETKQYAGRTSTRDRGSSCASGPCPCPDIFIFFRSQGTLPVPAPLPLSSEQILGVKVCQLNSKTMYRFCWWIDKNHFSVYIVYPISIMIIL